jgi:hypothetical protein
LIITSSFLMFLAVIFLKKLWFFSPKTNPFIFTARLASHKAEAEQLSRHYRMRMPGAAEII